MAGKDNIKKDETSDENPPSDTPHPQPETGGPKGPEPTRYGDWEINGKCVDF